jgi:hypothetical protein
MKRLIFVGINPSGAPFRKGCAIHRLHDWATDLGHYFYSFSNVIPYEGEYKMQDVDPDFVKTFCEGYEKVVALGGFASKALSKAGVQHYTMPHPSPLNRLLNDKEYEKRCVQGCKEWLRT